MLARPLRLGSLRAGSQVIRAHLLWRVNDERGRARITCSLRPCCAAGKVIYFLIYFLDEIQATERATERCRLEFRCWSRELSRSQRFVGPDDFEPVLSVKRCMLVKCRARNFAC